MKTAILLTVTTLDGKSLAPFFRVKLDSNKAPYIIVDNRKYFVRETNFPREISVDWGYTKLVLDVKDGLPQLKEYVGALFDQERNL